MEPQKDSWKVKLVKYFIQMRSLIFITEQKKMCFISVQHEWSKNPPKHQWFSINFSVVILTQSVLCVLGALYMQQSRSADIISCSALKFKLEKMIEHQVNRQRLWGSKETDKTKSAPNFFFILIYFLEWFSGRTCPEVCEWKLLNYRKLISCVWRRHPRLCEGKSTVLNSLIHGSFTLRCVDDKQLFFSQLHVPLSKDSLGHFND